MKQCSKCKKWKNESEFYERHKSKDGLDSWCKKCCLECASKYYKKGRATVKKYFRYAERHRVVKGVKEKRCRKCREWKPESEYYKKLKHKDGLAIWCKECADKASNKSRRKRLASKKSEPKAASG